MSDQPIKSDAEVAPPEIATTDSLNNLVLNIQKVIGTKDPDRPIFILLFDMETRQSYTLHKNLHVIPQEEREVAVEIVRHELLGS